MTLRAVAQVAIAPLGSSRHPYKEKDSDGTFFESIARDCSDKGTRGRIDEKVIVPVGLSPGGGAWGV